MNVTNFENVKDALQPHAIDGVNTIGKLEKADESTPTTYILRVTPDTVVGIDLDEDSSALVGKYLMVGLSDGSVTVLGKEEAPKTKTKKATASKSESGSSLASMQRFDMLRDQ